MISMYEIIMSLPLFKGTSKQQVSCFLEQTNIEFIKYNEGDTIVSAGEPCTHIKYIISGNALLSTTLHDGNVSFSQILEPYSVIMPEYLFGMHTAYPATVTAKGEVSIMQIIKRQYLDLLSSDPIFLINYINYLAYRAQIRMKIYQPLPMNSLSRWICSVAGNIADRHANNNTLTAQKNVLCTLFKITPEQLDSELSYLTDIDKAVITTDASDPGLLSIHLKF